MMLWEIVFFFQKSVYFSNLSTSKMKIEKIIIHCFVSLSSELGFAFLSVDCLIG